MKEIGRVFILTGCAFIVFAGDLIIGSYFGEISCLASLGVELVICGLLLIKSDDKGEDKL